MSNDVVPYRTMSAPLDEIYRSLGRLEAGHASLEAQGIEARRERSDIASKLDAVDTRLVKVEQVTEGVSRKMDRYTTRLADVEKVTSDYARLKGQGIAIFSALALMVSMVGSAIASKFKFF
jgi:uncharacterized protein YhaN